MNLLLPTWPEGGFKPVKDLRFVFFKSSMLVVLGGPIEALLGTPDKLPGVASFEGVGKPDEDGGLRPLFILLPGVPVATGGVIERGVEAPLLRVDPFDDIN